jgi:1,4-alpha-glucan branching enzyme
MGTEFAQDQEWAEQRSLDWGLLENPDHQGVQRLVSDLNSVYAGTPALWSQDTAPQGFQWIEADDASRNTVAFVRWGSDGSALVCVTNFSAVPHEGYILGLPFAGEWSELINTDAEIYGGSGVGNLGTVTAHESPYGGQSASARLRIPPLGTLWLSSHRAGA